MESNRSHFINGKWLKGSGEAFTSLNPATGEKIWKGHTATSTEVDQAIFAAREASFGWSDMEIDDRIHYLHAFAGILSQKKKELAETISQETGKPLWDASNEVSAMVNKINISIEAYQLRCPETTQIQGNDHSTTRHQPHGIMAVLGPFNFPGHLPNGHIVPSLLAGNTVVFKPSELTPLTAQKTLECWEMANLPAGVINLVQGGRDCGKALSEHPNINGLLFTGSWNTGCHLSQLFANQPEKILALEMGGNNPLVISTIQDLHAAAYLTIQSAFLSSGQRCTCARRLIIIDSPQHPHFLKTLIEMATSIHVGAYQESPEPFMGPLISADAASALLSKYESLVQQGAIPLLPMKRLAKGPAFLSPGIIDVTAITPPDEELFGPLLQVIRVPDFTTALKVANNTKYGLSAGLLSDNPAEYKSFYKHVKAGIVNWNTALTGASSKAPFGGIGHSGNHRPSALYAADYCAYPVASLERDTIAPISQPLPGINFFKN